jgi:hypothetical protein
MTILQNFQSPVLRGNTVMDARGWYHGSRRHVQAPFTVVAIQVPDPITTAVYRDGSPRSEGLPSAPGFTGILVGTGSGANFRPFLAASQEGRATSRTMVDMLRQLRQMGFKLPTCDFSPEPGISHLEPYLKGSIPTLLCMDDLGVAAALASHGRRTVALLKSATAAPVVSAVEEDTQPTPAPQPVPEVAAQPLSGDLPVAILSGGFSKPHAAYYAQLRNIGYQVLDSQGMTELDPRVKLVVQPTANRGTTLTRQALERGVKIMTASQLHERSHAKDVTSGR